MEVTPEELEMTAFDWVRHVLELPLTDRQAEYILWEKTCFPMDLATAKDQLLELKETLNV